MKQTSFINTTDALKKLGFEPDASVLSEDGEGLSYDFGNLTLNAARLFNRHFVETIIVSGIFASERIISDIQVQIPLRVSSIEQCAAFIAWGVGKNVTPLLKCQWLEIGRENFDLLPWVIKQKEYENRPQCSVERDWLKLALRDLRALLPILGDDAVLVFAFQNGIFSIRNCLKIIALPAVGNDWEMEVKVKARHFDHMPKRLNQYEIEISVWNEYLCLGSYCYPLESNSGLFA